VKDYRIAPILIYSCITQCDQKPYLFKNGGLKIKNNQLQDDLFSPAGKLPLNNIGVVFCTSNLTAKGREFEELADCEVVDEEAIKRSKGRMLSSKLHQGNLT